MEVCNRYDSQRQGRISFYMVGVLVLVAGHTLTRRRSPPVKKGLR
jgi:hypothetical protein